MLKSQLAGRKAAETVRRIRALAAIAKQPNVPTPIEMNVSVANGNVTEQFLTGYAIERLSGNKRSKGEDMTNDDLTLLLGVAFDTNIGNQELSSCETVWLEKDL